MEAREKHDRLVSMLRDIDEVTKDQWGLKYTLNPAIDSILTACKILEKEIDGKEN
jgi:hypothetical protein